MNIHSHGGSHAGDFSPAARRPPDAERRMRILEAAERAFVRNGFHATTMQRVADEAGMSAGNLYRTFPSKEAMVEGLCELDQAELAQAFAELMADNRQIMEAMRCGLRKHVLAKPPEKARLLIEIWAEAGRNPRVAQMTRAIDAEVRARGRGSWMRRRPRAWRPRASFPFRGAVLVAFVAGLFEQIATEADFDPEAETPMAIGVLKALLAGALCADPGAPGAEIR